MLDLPKVQDLLDHVIDLRAIWGESYSEDKMNSTATPVAILTVPMGSWLSSFFVFDTLAHILLLSLTETVEKTYGALISSAYDQSIWLSLHSFDRLALKEATFDRAQEAESLELISKIQINLIGMMNSQHGRITKRSSSGGAPFHFLFLLSTLADFRPAFI